MGRSLLEGIGILVILFSLFSLESTFAQKKRKSITTHLVAKWSNTPLMLEAAEFLSTESPDYFWSFIKAFSEMPADSLRHRTDQEMYELVLEVSARYLTPAQLDILRFSLSLRTESPKLEMYRQVAKDRGVDAHKGCPVVFDHDGALTCQLPAIVSDAKTVVTYASEHVFPGPGKETGAPTLVLYAEIWSPEFAQAHKQLAHLAEEGKVVYVLRHKVPEGEGKVRLSGYGVELQIKSTEYKAQDDTKLVAEEGGSESEAGEDTEDVHGFVFSKLKSLYPDKAEKLVEMKQYLQDMNNDMAPMKVWQLQDLSLQAAEMIMKSTPSERLRVMEDIAANFPSHARALARTAVSKELKKEVKKNSELFYSNMNVQTSDAALFINGMHYDMDYTDIFTILDAIRQEERVLGGLGRLGLDNKQTASLMSLDLGSKHQTYGVDIRDTAIHWINDIEKDKLYQSWPDSVQELLRPTFPGMLRSIRKNFFHVVILCDAASPASRPILKLAESFYIHRAPTKIGLVFQVPTDPAKTGENDVNVALNNAFNYIAEKKDPYTALSFITDLYNSKDEETEPISLTEVRNAFSSSYGSDVNLLDVFGEDSDYDVGRSLAAEFIQRTGLESMPQVLMNGVPMEEKYLSPEDFEEQLLTLIMKETQAIQKAVYRNQLTDSMDMLDHLMSRENIMPRLNQRILSSANNPVLSLSGDQLPELKLSSFSELDKRSMSATLLKHIKYLVGKEGAKVSRLRAVSIWIVADLDTPAGRDIARAAVQQVRSSNQLRVAFIHNTKTPGIITKAVAAALEHMDATGSALFVGKILKEETALKLEAGTKRIQDYDIPGVDIQQFLTKMGDLDLTLFDIHAVYIQKVLGLAHGDRAVITNGRIVGPLAQQETLSSHDVELLEKLTMSQYGEKLVQAFHNFLDVNKPDISDVALVTGALLTARPVTKSRQELTFRSEERSVVKVEPRFPDRPAFDLVAIVDPVSRGAQKIAPVLEVLRQVLNARIRVFLNCVEKHSEMPNKSYFRVVLEPWLQFGERGELVVGPRAAFHNIPEQPILTQNYHVPDNWLVEPIHSIYDLDNIKLESIETGVASEWELGSLLVEGHCFEAGSGNPPRGLQLTLGSKSNPNFTDTIVMANLGYLQLKADPGAWELSLRAGRSNDIYEIVSHENTDSDKNSKDIAVLVNSFQSRIVKLKAAKKPHMKHEELLPSDKGDEEAGLWSSIKSTFSSSTGESEEKDEGLNIFCLATGHLYERLLKIMMVSVLKHTKTPVKFWILKNFLSPDLKDFIPEYAKRYGFEYEYVQYKWPRWLNQQAEKQRTIWGYKILFLDVLFPLSLKKIIFVDTDQIVRTDLLELRDLDLGGAPYGYTPFCDSNKEMEGFRFWKQGYWRNHLAGRKYHISAIYVVDLVKFRQIAAGDRLRGQYQALSQDPNSLSNLDQDLPNNMIHQVPIKSLPQEWLWCETWCSTDELKNAKSIDLCNNPLTKEPKLSAARRIVTEWADYDEEMQRLAQQIAKDKAAAAAAAVDQQQAEPSLSRDEL